MIKNSLNHPKILRLLPRLMLALSILSLAAGSYFGYVAWQAQQSNVALKTRALLKQRVEPYEVQKAYNQGYLQAQQNLTQQAMQSFTNAEVSGDPVIRAHAKYAIGNLYFDMAMRSANIAAGGAHQQAVAQIELAREAYKGALRLNPALYDARFNLELLDRRSPEKRTQGWQAETDGVTLKPFKRNGTAMMRDNKRRGLP